MYSVLVVDQENRMRENVLRVLVNCLSYDFAGTSLDEAGEDVGTVQVNRFHHHRHQEGTVT
jgi:hypothetical protein